MSVHNENKGNIIHYYQDLLKIQNQPGTTSGFDPITSIIVIDSLKICIVE